MIRDLLNKIKILKDNEIYRINDLLDKPLTDNVIVELLTNDIYKDTIMKEYFTNHGKRDYKALYSIIERRSKDIELYGSDEVLVHLRTGDDYLVRGLANETNFNYFVDEISKYSEDKTIVFVTAMHYGHKANSLFYRGKRNIYNDKSRDINIELIEKLIEAIPHQSFKICSNDSTDIDMIHLALAENLIVSPYAGGFARVIIELNKIKKS